MVVLLDFTYIYGRCTFRYRSKEKWCQLLSIIIGGERERW